MGEKLTAAQLKVLQAAAADPLGLAPHHNTINGLGSAARRRMMARLCRDGLFRDYVHGGYEITEAGRARIPSHHHGQSDG